MFLLEKKLDFKFYTFYKKFLSNRNFPCKHSFFIYIKNIAKLQNLLKTAVYFDKITSTKITFMLFGHTKNFGFLFEY